MKPEDIVVGKKYRHTAPGMFGSVFLGCGDRVMWEGTYTNRDSRFTNKRLVIVEDNDPGYVGQLVKLPEDAMPGWWNGFEAIP